MMQTPRILLIHGAATTPAVWGRLVPMLAADDLPVLDVTAPERPSSGDLTIEVAHLAEMNHGPRFWRLVKQTMPRLEEAKRWLRMNGMGLYRYGA